VFLSHFSGLCPYVQVLSSSVSLFFCALISFLIFMSLCASSFFIFCQLLLSFVTHLNFDPESSSSFLNISIFSKYGKNEIYETEKLFFS
jgi:hypothetical protein